MPRKLKVFRTSIGFFDLAVAAPSMKAAAEAWGADPDVFRLGGAEQTDDPEVVEAALAKPGVVLRRPVGTADPFSEKAAPRDLPSKRARVAPEAEAEQPKAKARVEGQARATAERKTEREEAAARKAEAKRQSAERRERDAEEERVAKRRERAIAKAEAALAEADARHQKALRLLEKRRQALDEAGERERERWAREERDLRKAIDDARSRARKE